ncbi:hypothetical protein P3T36_005271 [Kitasatospora sp. MAP12-15]|uniref:hypothetical protein n=1 Tax=unclassified Kitasatospora TaxID=2633591 RepID=UPI00247647C6|nr:hypothetical protein [Kitasatospora sp. MAP12-44]MDH6113566.1 hypothetical protein [Kitasatospora sp. MAP12-44]
MDGIFIAAPPGAAWPLGLAEFEARVRDHIPLVLCFTRHDPVQRRDYLNFEADLDGMRRHGSYFEHSNLVLSDGDPAFWADTITWFLSLLPAAAPAVAMAESNPDDVVPVPAGASAEQIRDLLDTLVAG